jgi:hypothetical protein
MAAPASYLRALTLAHRLFKPNGYCLISGPASYQAHG